MGDGDHDGGLGDRDDPRDSGKPGMGTGLIPDGRRVPSSRTCLVAERAHWHAWLSSMSSPEDSEGGSEEEDPTVAESASAL
jgi:hypothetical protein